MSILQKLKTLFISTCVLFIMTGTLPCASYESVDLMEKTELTIYEQYLKDYAEQIVRAYTPEKYFPQKEMQFELQLRFKIMPNGSIRDIHTIWTSEDLSHEDPTWIVRPVYFWKLKRLSRIHEEYVKDMLISNGAKPLPPEFGDYILVNGLELRHWNQYFRKPIFESNVKFLSVFGPDEQDSYTFTAIKIYRSNVTSGR